MVEMLQFTEKENGYEVSIKGSERVVYWLYFYPERALLIHKWLGFQPDECWVAIWKYTLNFVQRHRVQHFKSIADTTELEGSFDGINAFVVQEILPHVIAGGLKYFAYILPREFYARLATQFYQEATKDVPFVTRYFDNITAAEKWLMSIEN
jgi:hypothetical protein